MPNSRESCSFIVFNNRVSLLQYNWYFEEEEEGEPPVDPPPPAEELSPAPAPSRDLLIHNVKKMEGKQ